ncbi:MAG: hypothetical protein KDB23_34395, partial [Planctomycetales bacterium]|nr:hypothetical protein [Planctomycetales bacterium]
HVARFNVSTQQLRAWIDFCRSRRPDLNRNASQAEWQVNAFRNSEPEVMQYQQGMFRKSFPDVNWSYDPAMVQLSVTSSDRGGGFRVWHLGSTGDTYIHAWYW